MYYPYANIHISSNGLLFYSENNKSACSTIGKTIGAKRIPHEKYFNLHAVPIFSVVRNPYSRFMSSFLYNCRHRSQDYFINWSPSDCTIDNYLTFLEYHSKEDNFRRFDPHQRPQSYNLCIDDINYDFIGKLEHLKGVLDYISSFGYKDIKTKNDHRTGAVDTYKKSLDSDQCSRIQKIFEKDFEAFKYSYDLDSSCEVKYIYASPNKVSFGQTFRIKVLIESLHMFNEDEEYKKLVNSLPAFSINNLYELFALPIKASLEIFPEMLNPIVVIMILSGNAFNGRLSQIILSLVEPIDFDSNLQSEDIDIVIQWCENNGFCHFLNTLKTVKKYYYLFKYETQYLNFRELGNTISLAFKDKDRAYAPSPGILLRDI
ncbi:sulfotransferase family 2 domain-containing protein [Synechococcus sp. UW179B]|uniref:sulfotransferase family 2 domain-containing protein n=1 Tax=Synechococcus sp. UW179B TaxID=2575516 RepID=UPI000E0E549E|nr:sulfotransferase family 2 domain-containing protein [Synechococcus sp. UW179B]